MSDRLDLRSSFRGLQLRAIAGFSVGLFAVGCSPEAALEPPGVRLDYVATAHQLGPVAYRDPLGSISPDGSWLAYTEGRRLLLQSILGGPVRELGPGDRRRDDLAWLPDGIHLAAREVSFDRGTATWFLYDVVSGRRQLLWPERETLRGRLESDDEGMASDGQQGALPADEVNVVPGALRHLAWSPDGTHLAGVVRTEAGSQLWIVEAEGGAARVRESNSRLLVFEGDDGKGSKGLYVVERGGGVPRRFHQFESDQLYSGVSVSPDFRWAAYVAPAADGYFQIFRVPLAGGEPERVTFDPSDKVHPSYSPNGEQIAFTVFRYAAHFWRIAGSREAGLAR